MEFELECKSVLPIPEVLREERATSSEVVQRRGVGRGSLGALACQKVELGRLLSLLRQMHQGRASTELIGDLEDHLLPLLSRGLRRKQSPYSKVHVLALWLRDQQIGGFLNSIMDKLVGASEPHDQLLTHGLPQRCVDLILRNLKDNR